MSQELYIPEEEFHEYAFALEKHHAIFYRFWSIGRPNFIDTIPTAQVTFDKEGDFISFDFNPNFWKKCSFVKRLFVIAHECLHLIHNHGTRGINLKNQTVANYGADVVVNHTLTSKFGFDRKEVDAENKYCWIDTVFKDSSKVELNKSFEYYYNLLIQEKDLDKSLVDVHNFGDMKDLTDFLDKHLSNGDKDFIRKYVKDNNLDSAPVENTKAGKGKGSKHWIFDCSHFIPPKRKWESVIKDWVRSKIRNNEKDEEQWLFRSRAHHLLSDDLLLPSDYPKEAKAKKKNIIDVYFFLDTSGSCWSLKDRFFRAAKSLPKDHFNIHLFCFDTDVYATTLASGKVYGGGGTEFDIIETQIQKDINSKKISRYPDKVWVLSDGHGSHVHPEFPERWDWFLTGKNLHYIPKDSTVHMLKDYE
jgi:Putative metallopeptidase domain